MLEYSVTEYFAFSVTLVLACVLCIDAVKEDRAFGRLVNDDHRHQNCRMKKIEVDGSPYLCLFTLTDIKEGDEITCDYGGTDWPWYSKVCKISISVFPESKHCYLTFKLVI